jgi:hypothetical protein
MRIRRASDNAELDIGFATGWLDTAAIATHCGVSLGYVVKWYDQSGNANDMSKVTASEQPQIYDGAAVIIASTKPAVKFLTNSELLPATAITDAQPNNYFEVHTADELVPANPRRIGFGNIAGQSFHIQPADLYRVYGGVAYNSTLTISLGTTTLMELLCNSAASNFYVGGTLDGPFDVGLQAAQLALGGSLNCWLHRKSEFIYYASDQSANRLAIAANINAAFGV